MNEESKEFCLDEIDVNAVMKQYLKKLQICIGVGVDTLLNIAADSNASRSERINASAKLIEQAQKAYELSELEARISMVEQIAKGNKDDD